MAVAQATRRKRAWLGRCAAAAAVPAAAWLLHRTVQHLLPQRVVRCKSTAVSSTALQTVSSPYGNPLPAALHVTLRANQLRPGRLVVIGDVHGCNQELQQLLSQVQYNRQYDNLVLVGDLVNKGPDSVGVLTTLQQQRGFAVRGNHDDNSLSKWHAWKKTGSIPLKHPWVANMKAEDAALLESLPFSLSLPDYGIVIVHAGLVPQSGSQRHDWPASVAQSEGQLAVGSEGLHVSTLLAQQQLTNLIHMRELSPAAGAHSWTALERRPQDDNTISQPWAQVWPGPTHVLFGHDARRRLQLAPYATGLDTGCLYGGQLTAAVLPPLAQLLKDSPAVAAHHAAAAAAADGEETVSGQLTGVGGGLPALTREDLQVQLVHIQAAQVYSKPKGTA